LPKGHHRVAPRQHRHRARGQVGPPAPRRRRAEDLWRV